MERSARLTIATTSGRSRIRPRRRSLSRWSGVIRSPLRTIRSPRRMVSTCGCTCYRFRPERLDAFEELLDLLARLGTRSENGRVDLGDLRLGQVLEERGLLDVGVPKVARRHDILRRGLAELQRAPVRKERDGEDQG